MSQNVVWLIATHLVWEPLGQAAVEATKGHLLALQVQALNVKPSAKLTMV